MNQYRRDFAGAAGLKPPFLYSGLAENDRHINKKLSIFINKVICKKK